MSGPDSIGPPGLGPAGLGPPGLLNSITSRFGPDAALGFQNLLGEGFSVSEALAQTLNLGNHTHDRVDANALAQVYDNLPPEVQQRIVQGADSLPPPVREALDDLGITQPQSRNGDPQASAGPQLAARSGDPPDPALSAAALREGVSAARGDAAQLPGLGIAQNPNAAAGAASPRAAQEASPQLQGVANQQIAHASQAERAFNGVVLPQQAGRAGEGYAAARDPAHVVVMADRANAALQQMPAQSLPPAQARADALAAQGMPLQGMAALAGATTLANPQFNPLPSQVAAPAPPGTDAAAAQARETQLSPAGHTVAGFLRRDLRRGRVDVPRERPADALLALLTLRRRRRDAEDEAGSFQWLFWVLTVVAYGALAIAVVAMIPSGGGLTDGGGRPTYGAYALVIGAIAAIASWFIGRRLAKR